MRYLLYGLRIEAPFPLPAPLDRSSGPPDVRVVPGSACVVPAERPSGQVLAELVLDGWVRYSVARGPAGVVARFYGLADFLISPRADVVEIRVQPGVDVAICHVLMAGTIPALLLSLRGTWVLHASAVEIDGAALAFCGPSGTGKSTIAGILCASGAQLVTDDVLAVRWSDEGVTCWAGARELRLRASAADVLARFTGLPARVTPDSRTAVAPLPSTVSELDLRAVVVPVPTRDASEVSLERLPPAQAGLHLAQQHRVQGWQDRMALRDVFTGATELARRVPVLVACLPWGPPHPAELAPSLLTAVAEELGLATAGL